MPDIYSLPLKRDLCSTFSINKTREHFSMGITDEAGASQFLGRGLGVGGVGDTHSFQEGRNAELATCWNYNHVLVFLQFCY